MSTFISTMWKWTYLLFNHDSIFIDFLYEDWWRLCWNLDCLSIQLSAVLCSFIDGQFISQWIKMVQSYKCTAIIYICIIFPTVLYDPRSDSENPVILQFSTVCHLLVFRMSTMFFWVNGISFIWDSLPCMVSHAGLALNFPKFITKPLVVHYAILKI